MQISVIIPSYKPQEYIEECLLSCKNQTFFKDSFEVIIVLNGCNEPYYTYINDFIQSNLSDLNIVLIQQDKGNVSEARNKALDFARGEYIAFLDDDDYISPSYLQELYDIAIQGYIPLSNLQAFDDNSGSEFQNYISDVYKNNVDKSLTLISIRSFFSVPVAKIMHRDIIEARRFDTRLVSGEDSVFMFSISDRVRNFKFTSADAIYFRRVRSGSAITQSRKNSFYFKNCFLKVARYVSIYFSAPFRYNFIFFLTRIMGSFKVLLINLRRNR